MSLLSVTVKRAKFAGPSANQLNTYATLQLQNVKSTTITVKGANPAWEQDFLFETNCLDTGLLIEVWNKGLIWDKALGHYWLPLHQVPYSNEEGTGQWISLDAEQIMENGVVVGTRNPTGDYLLIDCRFELPYDAEDVDTSGMARKLEAYNHVFDQEMATLRDGGGSNKRRQQQFLHSGLSEDSDYTSEVNYPLVHQANGSASQYLSVAGQYPSPQRSSGDISRENSYEISDPAQPTNHQHQYHGQYQEDQSQWAYDYSSGYPITQDAEGYYNYDQSDEFYGQADQWPSGGLEEPLYYNSRPNKELKTSGQGNTFSTLDSSVRRSTGPPNSATTRKSIAKGQKPSLERQSTLYDEQEATAGYAESYPEPLNNSGDYQEQYESGWDPQNQGDYSTSGSYGEQDQQQYAEGDNSAGADYNYDYNYGYSGQDGTTSEGYYDDGSATHGYGYYDDTGYYYDGQWYTYEGEGSWQGTAEEQQQLQDQPAEQGPLIEGQDYDYSGYPEEGYLAESTAVPSEIDPWQEKLSSGSSASKNDLYMKRRTMMHHGDLSSSGGSVESEQPNLRRGESIGSVTTPTGPSDQFGRVQAESPLMMLGELDRIQSDLLTSHRLSNGSAVQGEEMLSSMNGGNARMYDPHSSEGTIMRPRRDSVQSRSSLISQQSRRERAEGFRRRRSASICSDRDQPQHNSYEEENADELRTPVNELNLSMDDSTTPIASQAPFPHHHHGQYQKSLSYEDDDHWGMGGSEDHHEGQHMIINDQPMRKMDEPEPRRQQQEPPPTTPPPGSVISAPPAPAQQQEQQALQPPPAPPTQGPTPTVLLERPKLTARQKWLWAFNKISAQLVSPRPSFLTCPGWPSSPFGGAPPLSLRASSAGSSAGKGRQ